MGLRTADEYTITLGFLVWLWFLGHHEPKSVVIMWLQNFTCVIPKSILLIWERLYNIGSYCIDAP
jgi:hypothetical protein